MSIFDDSNHNKTTYLERYIVQKEIDKKERSDKKSADFYTLLKLIFSFFFFIIFCGWLEIERIWKE